MLGVFVRTVLGRYRRRARRAGVADGRTGTVTVVQRFGSGVESNVRFHALGLDGVFAPGADGTVRFHRLPAPTEADVARLVTAITLTGDRQAPVPRQGQSSRSAVAARKARLGEPYSVVVVVLLVLVVVVVVVAMVMLVVVVAALQ